MFTELDYNLTQCDLYMQTTGPIFYIWATLTDVNVTRKCFWLLCVCIWFTHEL